MMMSSECALVIRLDDIIEVQKGLDWVKKSSENQYQTNSRGIEFHKRFHASNFSTRSS